MLRDEPVSQLLIALVSDSNIEGLISQVSVVCDVLVAASLSKIKSHMDDIVSSMQNNLNFWAYIEWALTSLIHFWCLYFLNFASKKGSQQKVWCKTWIWLWYLFKCRKKVNTIRKMLCASLTVCWMRFSCLLIFTVSRVHHSECLICRLTHCLTDLIVWFDIFREVITIKQYMTDNTSCVVTDFDTIRVRA